MATHASASRAALHRHSLGNEERSSYTSSSALPNEAEINSMDVAELRQAMLGFVRMQKTASSASPSLQDEAISIHACSPPSPYASAASLAAASGADLRRARKWHRNDSDASASHRMGIDLLLNASTISDRMDSQLPSPPTHAKRSLSPAQLSSPLIEDGWHGPHRQTLPPISQMAGLHGADYVSRRASPPPLQESGNSTSSSSTSLSTVAYGSGFQGPLSAPVDTSFAVGAMDTPSLKAYKICNTSARPMVATSHPSGVPYAHSFPPPFSATRSHSGVSHQPSPPESQNSSPLAVVPTRGLHYAASPDSTMAIPSSAACVLPPTSDIIVCPDLYRTQPGPRSPVMRGGGLHSHQYRPYPQPQSHIPQTSSRNLYTHAQGYFAQRAPSPRQHPPMMPSSHQQPPMMSSPHQHHQAIMPPQPVPPISQQQHISVHMGSPPNVPVAMARNVSKPKFNYAFLDTKRPRGPSSRWTADEDELLKRAVKQFGEDRQWVKVAQQVPGRTNLQCRQRWLCNIKAQVEKERNAAKH
ncbi:myb-like DNA-binding protein bas1 [Coemansia erecta]|nr:myb-like DNA-binding protein bas1 [Coemansia erecta]